MPLDFPYLVGYEQDDTMCSSWVYKIIIMNKYSQENKTEKCILFILPFLAMRFSKCSNATKFEKNMNESREDGEKSEEKSNESSSRRIIQNKIQKNTSSCKK